MSVAKDVQDSRHAVGMQPFNDQIMYAVKVLHLTAQGFGGR